MVTVSCPHNTTAERDCPGCTFIQGETGRFCEGEIEGRVYQDTEGDAAVIGGLHDFWAVEDETADCDCALTEAEWDTVREKLLERGSEPDEDDYL